MYAVGVKRVSFGYGAGQVAGYSAFSTAGQGSRGSWRGIRLRYITGPGGAANVWGMTGDGGAVQSTLICINCSETARRSGLCRVCGGVAAMRCWAVKGRRAGRILSVELVRFFGCAS